MSKPVGNPLTSTITQRGWISAEDEELALQAAMEASLVSAEPPSASSTTSEVARRVLTPPSVRKEDSIKLWLDFLTSRRIPGDGRTIEEIQKIDAKAVAAFEYEILPTFIPAILGEFPAMEKYQIVGKGVIFEKGHKDGLLQNEQAMEGFSKFYASILDFFDLELHDTGSITRKEDYECCQFESFPQFIPLMARLLNSLTLLGRKDHALSILKALEDGDEIQWDTDFQAVWKPIWEEAIEDASKLDKATAFLAKQGSLEPSHPSLPLPHAVKASGQLALPPLAPKDYDALFASFPARAKYRLPNKASCIFKETNLQLTPQQRAEWERKIKSALPFFNLEYGKPCTQTNFNEETFRNPENVLNENVFLNENVLKMCRLLNACAILDFRQMGEMIVHSLVGFSDVSKDVYRAFDEAFERWNENPPCFLLYDEGSQYVSDPLRPKREMFPSESKFGWAKPYICQHFALCFSPDFPGDMKDWPALLKYLPALRQFGINNEGFTVDSVSIELHKNKIRKGCRFLFLRALFALGLRFDNEGGYLSAMKENKDLPSGQIIKSGPDLKIPENVGFAGIARLLNSMGMMGEHKLALSFLNAMKLKFSEREIRHLEDAIHITRSTRWSNDEEWLAFFSGKGTDDLGRTLSEILSRSDDYKEKSHHYIQRLFPIDSASKFDPGAPVLSEPLRQNFLRNPELQNQLLLCFTKMLEFYGFAIRDGQILKSENFAQKSNNWITPDNHNFFRIARMIRSLTLLGLEKEAHSFYEVLKAHLKGNPHVTQKTYEMWEKQLTR